MKNIIQLIVLAFIGGYLGFISGFPLGTLLGTLITVSVMQHIAGSRINIPVQVKRLIQILIGGNIGLNFNADTLSQLKQVWLLALVVPLLHILIALVITYILHYFFKVHLITALCSTAPAGIAEMSIISEKYHAYIPTVVTTHVFRLLIIITLVPLFISYF